MKEIDENIICAGFGGQGIMTLGKVLANAGMSKDLHVTWMPSYGAEVRGGTAHSMVRINSAPIGSPTVTCPDTAIILNSPSLDKFENRIKNRGLLILNTSMVSRDPERKDLDVVKADLTNEAIKLGNVRVANMIAAGIYAAKKGIFDQEVLIEVTHLMAAGRKDIIPVNIEAVKRGIEIASEQKVVNK